MNLIEAADELYAAFVSTEFPTVGQKEALKGFAAASNAYRTTPWAAIFKKLEPIPQGHFSRDELEGAKATAFVSIAISLKRIADSLDVKR